VQAASWAVTKTSGTAAPVGGNDLSRLRTPFGTRRFECGKDFHRSIGIPREDKPARLTQLAKNYDLFGAAAAFLFALDHQMGPGQCAHLGMLMQSIALVAEAKGLVTCMQELWMTRHTFIRRFFAIRDELQVYRGMAVGYADAAHPINSERTTRAPVDELMTFRC